jgi:methanogenic corrinoid protein MtbC1
VSKVYLGDVGTVIRVDMGADIAAATAAVLNVLKPDGTEDEWTGDVDTEDTQDIIYTTVEGDLDQVGEYLIQPALTFADWEGLGETVRLVVHPPYDEQRMIPVPT